MICETPILATPEELGLIHAVASGDDEAAERLVRAYTPRMSSLAKRLLRCEQDADDAVQDAFINIFRKASTFNGASRLWTWLHRITINTCLMRLRAIDRHLPIETFLPSFLEDGHYSTRPISWESLDPAITLSTKETRTIIRNAIDSLPSPYREVLLLRDIEELDTETAATLLNTTSGNVKTRLHRARQALRSVLESSFNLSQRSEA